MFGELKDYGYARGVIEAERCLNCVDPPCVKGCPVGVPVPQFIQAIKARDFLGAVQLIQHKNILGWSCGFLCPQEILCAKDCTRGKIDRALDIRGLQRFAYEHVGLIKESPPQRESSFRVAVVGGGPSGLASAFYLRKYGIKVTIFDANSEAGGIPRYEIPEFKLPKDILKQEIENILSTGIEFVGNSNVEDLDNLFRNGYDAVIVATGLNKEKPIYIKGELNSKGVYKAREVLRDPLRFEYGESCFVVGGGNTAIDVARSIKKLRGNNTRVVIIYRRSELEMPSWESEIEGLRRDGIEIRPFTQPVEIVSEGGKVIGIKIEITELGAIDETGRRSPVPLKDGSLYLKADSVVFAIGEEPDKGLLEKWGLEFCGSRLKHDFWGRSNRSKVYVAGDLEVEHPYLVVKAIASGKKVAESVLRDLQIEMYKVGEEPTNYNSLKIDYFGFKLENPFFLAAAPPTDELDMVKRGLERGWGGVVLKTTSIEGTRVELKYPMMAHLRRGEKFLCLGNIDLISKYHIDEVERRVEILKREFPNKYIIASIMGAKKEDWELLVKRLKQAGVNAIECSFSCPQGTLGSKPGAMLGQDTKLTEIVTGWVKGAAEKVPVFIKITPQVTDIVEIAKAVKKGGAEGITAANSVPGLVGFDIERLEPLPSVNGKTSYSGITGPAIKSLTLRTIAEIAKNVELVISGTGGPMNWQDAIEFFLVGATTVQFCTAPMIEGFELIDMLKRGVSNYLERHGFNSVLDLRGKGLQFITTHDLLEQKRKVVATIAQSSCIGCGRCYRSCLDGGHKAILWEGTGRKVQVDESRCVGCGFCSATCPTYSISYKEI